MKFKCPKPANSAFSLIELMIVIAIIGILVAVALPQFTSMTEDAKRSKAKQDCQTIVDAINKFNNIEKTRLTNLGQLKGKYIANLDTLRDPWGKSYCIDTMAGNVLSFGPDAKHSKKRDKTWDDDVSIQYIGALTLLDAYICINPENLPDTEAYDILLLKFNKPLKSADSSEIEIDFSAATSAQNEYNPSKSTVDDDAKNGKIFRWYMGSTKNFMKGDSPLKENAMVKCKIASPGDELYCKLPIGATGTITTNYLINITGSKSSPNPFFKTMDDIGAESSGAACKIKKYDSMPPEYDQITAYQSEKENVIIYLQ